MNLIRGHAKIVVHVYLAKPDLLNVLGILKASGQINIIFNDSA